MVKQILCAAILVVGLSACSNSMSLPLFGDRLNPETEVTLPAERVFPGEIQILAVLENQKNAWNNGDIDTFMEGYWKSDQLRFASGGTVTTGWQQTLDNYKVRYPNRAAMGALDFSDLDVDVTSADSAIVHGRWSLQRASDNPGGLFTLSFRKFDESWLIVSDTTTSE